MYTNNLFLRSGVISLHKEKFCISLIINNSTFSLFCIGEMNFVCLLWSDRDTRRLKSYRLVGISGQRLDLCIGTFDKFDTISLVIFLYDKFSWSCHFCLSNSSDVKDNFSTLRKDESVTGTEKRTFDLFSIIVDSDITFCFNDLSDVVCLYTSTTP